MGSGKGASRDAHLRVHVAVTDESGRVYEGHAELVLVHEQGANRAPRRASQPSTPSVDLTLPLRPFLKKYSRGRSGPSKFTLLLAHLAKGGVNVGIDYTDLVRAWNRATAHLGQFNPAHTTRAKDKGWVDSPKQGQYVLRPSWKQAFAD